MAISFVSSFSRVSAACDNNIFESTFTNGEKQIQSGFDEEQPQHHAVYTVDVLDNAKLVKTHLSLLSDLGKCPTASISTYLAQDVYPGGLTLAASDSMVNAFLTGPSENIGAYYAQMLLPREITGSSAYAANCDEKGLLTSAPKCRSASGFWSDYGISNLWGVSFALAMIMVVVVLLISGFMIMFRSRIGGQVVVTVSMALQNVILASVMALASFALGAFFVNLSKALMLVIANLFTGLLWANLGGNDSGAIAQWLNEFITGKLATTYLNDPLGMFAKFVATLFAGDAASLSSSVGTILGNSNAFDAIKSMSTAGIKLVFFMVADAIISPFYLLVRILIAGALLIASIRIYWAVVKTYIVMAIDVIGAPVLFVISAIPSKSTAVKDWLLRMFRNSITAPMMFAMVNATTFIIIKTAIASGGDGGWLSDPVEAISGGAIARGTGGLLISLISPQAILSVVLLNMIPSIPSLLADLFAGKGTGALDAVNKETMKQLQKIPVAGSLFS